LQPINVSVYSVPPGVTYPAAHYHPDTSELVICYRGEGIAYFQESGSYRSVKLKQGDTLLIPAESAHCFFVPDKPDAKDLVLYIVHATASKSFPQVKPDTPPPLEEEKIGRYRRNWTDPEYLKWSKPERRANRSRIWGRIAQANGEPDLAKPDFHLTLYTFLPGQKNPEHFHPHSIEFVLSVEGKGNDIDGHERCFRGAARTDIRHLMTWSENEALSPGDFRNGWQRRESVVLSPGDSLIVPKAGMHEYTTPAAVAEPAVILALQTPQPISHMLHDQVENEDFAAQA
jgi:quercetin dioxygenase-like cupin family protein